MLVQKNVQIVVELSPVEGTRGLGLDGAEVRPQERSDVGDGSPVTVTVTVTVSVAVTVTVVPSFSAPTRPEVPRTLGPPEEALCVEGLQNKILSQNGIEMVHVPGLPTADC
jgi:hypothetical protein